MRRFRVYVTERQLRDRGFTTNRQERTRLIYCLPCQTMQLHTVLSPRWSPTNRYPFCRTCRIYVELPGREEEWDET